MSGMDKASINQPQTPGGACSVMLSGAGGALGQAIERCAHNDDQVAIVARYQQAGGFVGEPLGDVIIDVSHHTRTPDVVAFARRHGCALLIGTTALDEATLEAIGQAGQDIAVCVAANFSPSAWAFEQMAQWTAEHLPSFDVALRETHHVHKKDAPSGTALRLQQALAPHRASTIPIESVREGEVVGQHEVNFTHGDERLRLVHDITNRDVFARGALALARRLADQPPGQYSVGDLWGSGRALG